MAAKGNDPSANIPSRGIERGENAKAYRHDCELVHRQNVADSLPDNATRAHGHLLDAPGRCRSTPGDDGAPSR
jgi:hypothetical protein